MSQNIKSSPLKILGQVLGGLGQVAGAIDWGGKRKAERAAAESEYNQMRRRFEDLDTSNLYAGVTNPYANMENVYEDLTVNQQEAQFMKQQQQQQQANVMQQMGGAAGGSGIAGLAQAMSNQGSIQAQRAAASIGKQEQATQMAGARGAEQVQTMERQGGWKAEMTRLGGASQARGLEADKVSTLFSMGAERLGAAKSAQQQAKADMFSGFGNIAGGFLGGGVSDRKLKRNIKLIDKSPSGLNIYSFKYRDSKFGEGTYQGVMADEMADHAVIRHPDGYDMVDYGQLDVNFKEI